MNQASVNNTIRKNINAILFLTFFDQISLAIGFPVLPFLCYDKHSTLFAATTSEAVRSIWYGVLSAAPYCMMIITLVFLGFLSDLHGRKKILIIGAFGALFLCVSTVFSIYFGSITLLLVGYLIGGALARTEPISLAAISDISPPAKKIVNMGYLQFAVSCGVFFGPLIGGYFAKHAFFHTLNYSLPYMIGTIMATLAILCSAFAFKETHFPVNVKKVNPFISAKTLLDKNIIIITIILILTQASWRAYYQFMPAIIKVQLHYQPLTVGIFISLIALWLALASGVMIKWLNNRFTAQKILSMSVYVLLGGMVIAIIGNEFNNQILIWISAMPVAMSDVVAFCAITTLYSNHVAQHEQGKMMGYCFIVVGIVWTLTGLLSGVLAAVNMKLPIIFSLVVLIPTLFLVRHKVKT
jgi:MFS family permease